MKKRITIFGVNYYPAKGGTSTVVENLILQLKDKYEITIYCYANPLAAAHIPGVKAVEFKPLFKGSLGSLIYFFRSALHILFFEKADLINAHKTDCALFIPLLRLRFKVVATSHEAPYKRDKWNAIQKLYFKCAEMLFIQSANFCTCISEPLTAYYRHTYKKHVEFIPNGINIISETVYDMQKAGSFVPEGADINKPFILFSARRLMATKGCHTMLEAFHILNYKGQIFISGELEDTPYLSRIRKLSVGLNVHFLGFIQPLNALLGLISRCVLFIFPSETEGMSIMLLEVASTGKVIIASDIPENEQVFDKSEVIYFKTGDAEDLAGKINYCLHNVQRSESIGHAAQKRVYNSYLWLDIARKYDRIFARNI